MTEHPDSLVMSDAALLAFVAWCRMNHPAIVYDPAIARRVYDAYDHDEDDHRTGIDAAAGYPSVTSSRGGADAP